MVEILLKDNVEWGMFFFGVNWLDKFKFMKVIFCVYIFIFLEKVIDR